MWFVANLQWMFFCLITVSGHKSWSAAIVWSKTTLITGDVGGEGVDPPKCKMGGTFLQNPLALSVPIISNFQLNGASAESLKLWLDYYNKSFFNEISKLWEFFPKLHLIGNCF